MKKIITAVAFTITTSTAFASQCVESMSVFTQDKSEVDTMLQIASVAQPEVALSIYSALGMLTPKEKMELADIRKNQPATRLGYCWTN
jgi:hypothetical protein